MGRSFRSETVHESPWWRVDQAAEYCRVHRSQIFRAGGQRQLEHVKIGGRRAIALKRDWLDAWMESQRVHVAPMAGAR